MEDFKPTKTRNTHVEIGDGRLSDVGSIPTVSTISKKGRAAMRGLSFLKWWRRSGRPTAGDRESDFAR